MANRKILLTRNGLPKDEMDWSVEDWRELHEGIERIKARIAARYQKPDHQNRAPRHLGVSSGEWLDELEAALLHIQKFENRCRAQDWHGAGREIGHVEFILKKLVATERSRSSSVRLNDQHQPTE